MPDQSETFVQATKGSAAGREDFSLVLGGPLFQLFRRARLSGSALELVHRRIAVLVTITWLPLLVLSIRDGLAWGNTVTLPFISDIGSHTRFLIALPLLLIAEPVVHRRIPLELEQFTERQLVPDEARGQFADAVNTAKRWRNSIVAELLILVLVYVVGVFFVWPRFAKVDASGWRGTNELSQAGWWFLVVSLPIFQFLLLRWYYRLFIWARFLWQVSKIKLRLLATHPDRRAGLGFLANVTYGFMHLLLAQGVFLSGMIANQIFYDGKTLPELKFDIIGFIILALVVILLPLLFFSTQLAEARRVARRHYGILAQNYIRDFDRKWIVGEKPKNEELMGSADIQSLADMGNSFQVIDEMKIWPFTAATILQLALAILLPLAPLLATVVPVEELVSKVIRIIF